MSSSNQRPAIEDSGQFCDAPYLIIANPRWLSAPETVRPVWCSPAHLEAARSFRIGTHAAQSADNTSACSSTVRVAFSCLSGG